MIIIRSFILCFQFLYDIKATDYHYLSFFMLWMNFFVSFVLITEGCFHRTAGYFIIVSSNFILNCFETIHKEYGLHPLQNGGERYFAKAGNKICISESGRSRYR